MIVFCECVSGLTCSSCQCDQSLLSLLCLLLICALAYNVGVHGAAFHHYHHHLPISLTRTLIISSLSLLILQSFPTVQTTLCVACLLLAVLLSLHLSSCRILPPLPVPNSLVFLH